MFRELKNEDGYTMIELMGTMVIVGVLSAVAVKKSMAYIDLTDTVAKNQVVNELNVRSMQSWADRMITNPGFRSDQDVFDNLDKNLSNVTWRSLSQNGGQFEVGGKTYSITRNPSTIERSARWE